jgi:hypothetical protein
MLARKGQQLHGVAPWLVGGARAWVCCTPVSQASRQLMVDGH